MGINGNYIQNQFCSYKIALKLKELGFNEECLAYFRNDKYQDLICTCENVMDGNFIVNHYSGDINAPLWQQVIDWFREKYNLYLEIQVGYSEYYFIWRNRKDAWSNELFCIEKESYEEAHEQAILKAIELCQEKKN